MKEQWRLVSFLMWWTVKVVKGTNSTLESHGSAPKLPSTSGEFI
jgi:hypothetical protein